MRSNIGRKSEELFGAEIQRLSSDVISGALTERAYSFTCGQIAGLVAAVEIIKAVEEDREK